MGFHWSDEPVRSESVFHAQGLNFHDIFPSAVNSLLPGPTLSARCSCCAVHWTTDIILVSKKQGKGWLFAPHRLMQPHKEAEIAVAEGWEQKRAPGEASHPTSRLWYSAPVPGSFTPRTHQPVQSKIQEKHMLTIFLLQTCQVFIYYFLLPVKRDYSLDIHFEASYNE